MEQGHGPTSDELEVMELVALGLKDVTIARRLGVAVITVRRRAQRFRDRLGARNRTHAVALGARHGLLLVGESGAPAKPDEVRCERRISQD